MNGKNKKDKAIHTMPKDFYYYLTMFKIEGHTTWRCVMSMDKKSFSKAVAADPNHPKITDIKILLIDRITGELKEQIEE